MKVLADSVLGEGPLPGLLMSPCLHMDTEKCVPVSASSYKDTNPSQGAPSS